METPRPSMSELNLNKDMSTPPEFLEATNETKADPGELVSEMLDRQGYGTDVAQVTVSGDEIRVEFLQNISYPEAMKIGQVVRERMNDHNLPQRLFFHDQSAGEHGAGYLIPTTPRSSETE